MEAVQRAELDKSDGRRRSDGRIAAASLKLLPDERLAHLAADSNQAAFAAIYERHHQALYRYCRTITRNDEDARDALQTTMLNAMRSIDTKPTKLRAWLYRIAHNESISVLRSGKRHAAAPLDDVVEPSAEAPLESRRELREMLDDIGHLSEKQRQALVMRELGGLSYEEISDSLDCSPAAAKQAAFDARGALHELAEARDTDCQAIRKRISDGDRRLLRARGVRAHLRGCDPCRSFEAAMQTRQTKLAGLIPVLSPAASAAILQSVLGGAGASGAAVAGASAAGGAAAVGGGAAAAGSGAAAIGGGAAISGAALKGIVAGVAALVATGGAIAVKERSDSNGRDGSAAAQQVREAGAPAAGGAAAADGSSQPTAGGETGSSGSNSDTGANADGKEKGGQGNGTAKEQGGSAADGAAGGGETPPAGSEATGPRPPKPGGLAPRPGPRPGPIGEPRPPRPGPGPAGGGPGTGTQPKPSPTGENTQPPPTGSTTPLQPRPPRVESTPLNPRPPRLPAE